MGPDAYCWEIVLVSIKSIMSKLRWKYECFFVFNLRIGIVLMHGVSRYNVNPDAFCNQLQVHSSRIIYSPRPVFAGTLFGVGEDEEHLQDNFIFKKILITNVQYSFMIPNSETLPWKHSRNEIKQMPFLFSNSSNLFLFFSLLFHF